MKIWKCRLFTTVAVLEAPNQPKYNESALAHAQTRPLEWRRRQLEALRRLVDENEEALLEALKADLHRGRFAALALEIWDVLGQVCVFYLFLFLSLLRPCSFPSVLNPLL